MVAIAVATGYLYDVLETLIPDYPVYEHGNIDCQVCILN